MNVPVPTIDDVLAARRFLEPHIRATPLLQRPAVSEAIGLEVWLKCESLLPTGAFKVRGGLNLVGRDPTARKGVMAASTGNHGQSLAYAGMKFDVPVTIFVPRNANPLKLAAMRAYGATLVEHGVDFDEARIECEHRAKAEGVRYVHSGDEPYLIAGVATAPYEVLRELPSADVLIVPVGGGSGAAGACIVAKASNRAIQVIGVQSEGAPAAYLSWRDRAPRETERVTTFADGLATRTAFALPQRILREHLDDFVLVSDDELYKAMRVLLVEGHVVAEGAGAAPLAAARKLRARLAGETVGCWGSGGRVPRARARVVSRYAVGELRLRDRDAVYRFLSEEAYWSQGLPRDIFDRALDNSLSFAAYSGREATSEEGEATSEEGEATSEEGEATSEEQELAGYARVVTDKATYAWLCDVFVLPAHRGNGVSKLLMDAVMAHPDLGRVRTFMLATRDAHGLYERYGFTPLAEPGRWMAIRRPYR